MTEAMSNMPDYYREWAKKEAEREYEWPFDNADTALKVGLNEDCDANRQAYEAALLRMWPLVEALEDAEDAFGFLEKSEPDSLGWAGHNTEGGPWPIAAELKSKMSKALTSLNLPKP